MALDTLLPTIMVAPNGARRTREDHPQLPVTIEQTVETAKACYQAGAGAIHAHVRDDEGKHVLDAGLYSELLAALKRDVPDMLVQITTEAVGLYSPEQQRALVKQVMPDFVSVAPREMTADGNTEKARAFYHWAADNNIQVQHLLYAPEEVVMFNGLLNEGVIPNQYLKTLFVLGKYATQQESAPQHLSSFLTEVGRADLDLDWGICAFGHGETACIEEAFRHGGKARVGFENSLWNADGSLAKDNAERVSEIAGLLQ